MVLSIRSTVMPVFIAVKTRSDSARHIQAHPKTLFEIAMALLMISVSFPSKSRFSATFSILLRFGGIQQILRDSTLTGRWWEGRILINLCGKNNVWNCDLLQRDFLACVVTFGKRWGPEMFRFFTLEKHATKSHLPKLIFRASRSDISGLERVSALSNVEMKLHGVSSTGRVLKFVCFCPCGRRCSPSP